MNFLDVSTMFYVEEAGEILHVGAVLGYFAIVGWCHPATTSMTYYLVFSTTTTRIL
jgi:hypothetical protein